MENLFYSNRERKAFYIPGYVDIFDALEQAKMLTEYSMELNRLANTTTVVMSQEILKSSRYKSMRVFFCECNTVPEGAFELGVDWTMDKWITN